MTLLSLLAAACTPRLEPAGPPIAQPEMTPEAFAMADGARLPFRAWFPEETPMAVVLALHGFNDYSKAFEGTGSWLARHGVAVYAYDQRGFGNAPNPGKWAGAATLIDDLKQAARLLKAHHPTTPLFLLGDSMGGAVVLSALASNTPPQCQAAILVAPALWGRDTMVWPQRAALWLFSHTLPWATGSGKGLNRWPSDNIEMLRALGRDPLVIKETRVDAIYGVTNLMDEALASAPKQKSPFLLLYGGNDQIIPNQATKRFLEKLRQNENQKVVFYPEHYHMILRDLKPEDAYREMLDYLLSKSILGSTK